MDLSVWQQQVDVIVKSFPWATAVKYLTEFLDLAITEKEAKALAKDLLARVICDREECLSLVTCGLRASKRHGGLSLEVVTYMEAFGLETPEESIKKEEEHETKH